MSERKIIAIGEQLSAVYAWLAQTMLEGTPDEQRAAQTARHAMDYLRTPAETEIRIQKRAPYMPFGMPADENGEVEG